MLSLPITERSNTWTVSGRKLNKLQVCPHNNKKITQLVLNVLQYNLKNWLRGGFRKGLELAWGGNVLIGLHQLIFAMVQIQRICHFHQAVTQGENKLPNAQSTQEPKCIFLLLHLCLPGLTYLAFWSILRMYDAEKMQFIKYFFFIWVGQYIFINI